MDKRDEERIKFIKENGDGYVTIGDLEIQETLGGKKIFKFSGERKKPKPFTDEKKGGLSRFEQEGD